MPELHHIHPAQAIVTTIALILLWGVASQFLARRSGLPAILFLLLGGLGLGEAGLGLVSPQTLGDGLRALIALAVAVIVFDGAFNIDVRQLRHTSRAVLLLVTIGAGVTWLLAGTAAHLLLGTPWKVALLYGAIVSVTGPTVIAPIIKRLPLPHRVRTILEAESVLVDAVGVLLTGAMFSYITGSATGLLGGAVQMVTHLAVGAAVGTLTALLLRGALRLSRTAPPELVRLGALAGAVVTYAVAEGLARESGIAAVALAGLVLGSLKLPHHETVKQFKGDLTTLALGLVFVLLAAGMNLGELRGLGWGGLAVVGLLMAAVRPLAVGISTLGSPLSWRERAFIAWMGPRGIVAASLGSLMGLELAAWGVQGGEVVGPLVLLTVIVTVLVEGGGAAWAARRLNVMPKKILVIGGDEVARELAARLHEEGEHVTLLDSEPANVRLAHAVGLHALVGDATSEEVLHQAGIDWCEAFVAASPSDKANLMLCQSVRALRPAPRMLARVNDSKNLAAFAESGIPTVTLTQAAAAVLAGLVTRPLVMPMVGVGEAAAGRLELLEVQMTNPRLAGRTLRELALPPACLVATIQHRDASRVADGDTVLELGVRLTLVGERELLEQIRLQLEDGV
ncbi:MAG: cation:proton antiporter [Candidatus Sericytochromatia bacterium]|nr:cation:proton antiporter [Candidatus Sericytochromatia bacterium]